MEIHSPEVIATPEHIAELDRLGDEIAELSAHLDAATARLLDLIREFDARGGWGNGSGFHSCAHWLNWRVGLGLVAAREKVRVARALGTLPRIARALARGEISYAKARAITRVATPARPGRARDAAPFRRTSTRRCWRMRISPASPCSRAAHTFPRKRPSAWRATPAGW
jgi:hypothetical protein